MYSSAAIALATISYIYKYTEKIWPEFSTRVGTIARRQKVLKQVGVVHDIKSQ